MQRLLQFQEGRTAPGVAVSAEGPRQSMRVRRGWTFLYNSSTRLTFGYDTERVLTVSAGTVEFSTALFQATISIYPYTTALAICTLHGVEDTQ